LKAVSDDLYRTVLFFDGRKGMAKSEGVTVELAELPTIDQLPEHTVEAYFYPQVRDFRLRESAGAIREMYPPEIEAIIQFLASIAAFGRRLRSG
jgi:hypothetical protein